MGMLSVRKKIKDKLYNALQKAGVLIDTGFNFLIQHSMKYLVNFSLLLLIVLAISCDKLPYEPPAYHAKAIVIGEEKCSVDSNYNYWLLDLSIQNTSDETGDTIIYNGVQYNHAFKAQSLDPVLHKPGNKVEFNFNFLYPDNQKIQRTDCDAPGAETFLLIGIGEFDVKEIH